MSTIAINYMTNGEEIMTPSFKVYGLYIAADENTCKYIDNLELNKKNIIEEFNNNNILTYNCIESLLITYRLFNYTIPFDKIEDMYILDKILNGGKKNIRGKPETAKEIFKIKKENEEKISKINNELNIDLREGYKVWLKHNYCGYRLIQNGAYWNEDNALELKEWCNTTKYNCLINLIKSPLSKECIKNTIYDEYLSFLMDAEGAEILLEEEYEPIRKNKTVINVTCKTKESEEKLKTINAEYIKDKKNRVIYKIDINNFKEISKKYNEKNPELFNEYYNQYISEFSANSSNLESLLKLINPCSVNDEFKSLVASILITEEISFARLYLGLKELITNPLFNIDIYKDFYSGATKVNNLKGELHKFSSFNDFKFAHPEISYYETNSSKEVEKLSKIFNLNMSENRKFELFRKANIDFSKINDKKIKEVIVSACDKQIRSLDSGSINDIYQAYLILGTDIENENTWNERFKWLFNFKLYKKMDKLVSTYIDGKVGHQSVYYALKNELESGHVANRVEKYNVNSDYNNNKYSELMQMNFNVNEAITGRWTSGFHNIPSGECVKSMFTSRFRGGCIAMPDGCQMEIRALAAECGDENLFRAFRDGLDIHKYFASEIYKVPYTKVTPTQRYLAKSAVFGIIYGISEHSLAEKYTNGNLQEAKNIYNSMYESFPKIKDYVERSHNEFEKFGKVTTLTNRFISLDSKRNKKALKRESQNYKIQGYAADLAGLIMFEIQDYIDKHNMKSKLICMVHDSIETDMHPDEVFELVDVINKAFNEYPMKEFGVPVACDVPLGASMGAECKINKMIHSDDYNEVVVELKGYIKDIDDLFNIWKNDAYDFVEYIGEKEYSKFDEDEYQPWANMMGTGKSVITKYVGQTLKKGTRKIHIIRHK